MEANSLLPLVVGVSIIVLVVGLIMKHFKQPMVIGYILAGVLIGPYGLQLIHDENIVGTLGEFGVMLLLFFAGLELSFPRLLQNWRIAIMGTSLQVALSIAAVGFVGWYFHWSISTRILLGFIISLSSTALVLKILEDRKEHRTPIGQKVIGILLTQDILVIFMLISLNFLSGTVPSITGVVTQVGGSILVLAAFTYLAVHKGIPATFARTFHGDPEIQVFAALLLCFGMAFFTQLLDLSSALGAFLAGMLIAATPGTEWVHDHLNSFRVLFVALFFTSVGMLINPTFLWNNLLGVLILVGVVLLLKTFLNAAVLRLFGESWCDSLYSGALLSQIGEFSFVLGAIALQSSIIDSLSHQMIVNVICVTLILTPFWILLIDRSTGHCISQSAKKETIQGKTT